jgi:hypothetical protein
MFLRRSMRSPADSAAASLSQSPFPAFLKRHDGAARLQAKSPHTQRMTQTRALTQFAKSLSSFALIAIIADAHSTLKNFSG